MGRRNWWMLAVAWLTSVAPGAGAVHVIPAVDLPSAVPDAVRDRVARELASNRDRLSGVVHPFRGEFHGLGAPAGGSSAAYDLSADGRVVVGADVDNAGDSEGFVWSPWTGRATYNMRPSGVPGDVVATTISADGVYVAGDIAMPNGDDRAFRWSLVGKMPLVSPTHPSTAATAVSADGSFTVGTASFPISRFPDPFFCSGCGDFYPGRQRTQAYRHTSAGGVELFADPPGYHHSEATDVSRSGIALVNGQKGSLYAPIDEPFLWDLDGSVQSLGHALLFETAGFSNQRTSTNAAAISADASTVVGTSTLVGYYQSFANRLIPFRHAVLWRDGTGWIDLGRPSGERLADDLNASRSIGSAATGVTEDGTVVLGAVTVTRQFQLLTGVISLPFNVPFLWDERRGMRELSDVLRLDYGLSFDGWSLGEATAISDDGTTIIGNGTNPDGDAEAWRAVLDRGTPDGDLDFDGDVDHHDYQTLVSNLGLDAATDAVFYADGDLNADGLVDQTDAESLLARYEHRWMGDFNADGLVDLTDYTFWRDRDGLFTGGLADSNGDGWANRADLAAWRTHFGQAVEGLSARLVPEPSALAVVITLFATAAAGLRTPGQGPPEEPDA